MHRLFVALRPPRATREGLLDLMEGVPGARWQDDDQLHLTLRFIGEVDGHVADDIAAALGGVRHPALDIAPVGVGRFEKRGRADALWAGISPRDEVAALHRKVDQALVRVGLAPEGRAFLPHITLARLPRGAGPIEPFLSRHAGLTAPAEHYVRFHLYESRLASTGAAYEIVETYPLG
ncbi:RNA 2',3'-cyclic phosphodiesterase [Sphingomonas jatrophae]|uniref:RNA 2',3'-cyclic phosphodiesterase n=1 Tax=Sphingomonas jatrophae TaxID=1166337 RepID=A0A1I6L5Q2_9SPHN|nr:RNA 2',3'-cyclic phosphodiesterase [Sphingomonas jatrophae]SFR98805.1 2'-5' RNA ligase [Sphingomonas jatrophae]